MVHRLVLPAGCLTLLLLSGGASRVLAQPSAAPGPTPTVLDDPALFARYQRLITPGGLAADVYFLASDLLEGRETGQPGQRLAAHYLAARYRTAGAAPVGAAAPGSPHGPEAFFQPFTAYRAAPEAVHLEVRAGDRAVWTGRFPPDGPDSLFAYSFGAAAGTAGGVVFGGYGIADANLGYDDYAALAREGLRLDGKWLVLLRDEPLANDSTSLLPTPDGRPSRWTTNAGARRVALYERTTGERGIGRPAGVLVVHDAGPRAGALGAAVRQAAHGLPRANLSLEPSPPGALPPIYLVSHRLADRILAPSGHTVAGLRQAIDRQRAPVVFEVPGLTVHTTVTPFPPVETENVAAFIEGSDPALRTQVVVVTSHYDHLGVDPARGADAILNGATDDASGTAATLAMAQAFARARADGFGPRRSVLFVNFSGEERGLAGSRYFTDTAPLVPLAQVAANLNMDGIGGTDTDNPTGSADYLYVVGSHVVPALSAGLRDLSVRLNDATGLRLQLDAGENWGSDHRSFERHLVPFLYFTTGLTDHYHQPGDEAATIDYAHMARAVQLAFATAWQVANQDAAPDRPAVLPAAGYVCPPCPVGCDHLVFDHPDACPICGMGLIPRTDAAR